MRPTGRPGNSYTAVEAWIARILGHIQANISPASVLGHHVNGVLVLAYRLHAYPDGSLLGCNADGGDKPRPHPIRLLDAEAQ